MKGQSKNTREGKKLPRAPDTQVRAGRAIIVAREGF
jgi:hypothetical protein